MRAVNLLPRDDRRQRGPSRRENPLVIGGVAGTVLVTAVLCAWFLTASAGVADNQKRRDAAQAELAATPVPPPPSSDSTGLAQEKSARIAALSSALGDRPAEGGNAAIVVVAVGHERSTLAVANGEVCEFTRVIEWGGANLSVAIARAVDIAPSSFVLSLRIW